MSNRYRKVDYDTFALAVREAKKKAVAEVKATFGHLNVQTLPTGYMAKAGELGVAVLQNELIKLFAADNPKFNKLLFVEACGHGGDDAPAPKS